MTQGEEDVHAFLVGRPIGRPSMLRDPPALVEDHRKTTRRKTGKTSCNTAPPSAAARPSRSMSPRRSTATRPRLRDRKVVQIARRRLRQSRERRPDARHPSPSQPRPLRVDRPGHLARWHASSRSSATPSTGARKNSKKRRNLRRRSDECGCGLARERHCRRRRKRRCGPTAPHPPTTPAAETRAALGQRQPPRFLQRRSGRRLAGPYRAPQPHLYWVDTDDARHRFRRHRTVVQRASSARSNGCAVSARLHSSRPPASAPRSKCTPWASPRNRSIASAAGPARAPPSMRCRGALRAQSAFALLLAAASPTKSISPIQRGHSRSSPAPSQVIQQDSSPNVHCRRASRIAGRPTMVSAWKEC